MNETTVTQADIDLATLCVPGALIFADAAEHIADARRRAAEHIARARLATPAPDSEKLREAAIEECAALVDRAAEQAEAVAEQALTGPGKHNLTVRAAAARSLAAAIRGIPRRTATAALGASS